MVYLSWQDVFEGARFLSEQMVDVQGEQYFCLGRGGLQVVCSMMRFRNIKNVVYLPVDTESLRSGEYTEVRKILQQRLAQRVPIVLVDDIYDTGRTFLAIRDEICFRMDTTIYSLALCSRYGRGKEIELKFWKNILGDDWVLFPWETFDETIYDDQLIPF